MPEHETPELRIIKGAVELNLAVLKKIMPEPRTLREQVDRLSPEGRVRLAENVGIMELAQMMMEPQRRRRNAIR